jgi:citrate lyase subunit beta / citryl-CoA lyase
MSVRRWRSLLFVPANAGDLLARAHLKGADGLIIDLEDGVDAADKETARAAIPILLPRLMSFGTDLVIRINAGWLNVIADLHVAIRKEVAAIVVPKAEEPDSLRALSEVIRQLEVERGLEQPGIPLIALVESPRGLARALELASVPRVCALALGSEDFSVAIGAAPTASGLDLPCRQLALAAATRALQCLAVPFPIGSFKDLTGFRSAIQLARSIGCTGALCVHPAQVAAANECFTPSEQERAQARQIVAAWDSPARAGRAVIVVDEKMVDLPVVARARNVLGQSASARQREPAFAADTVIALASLSGHPLLDPDIAARIAVGAGTAVRAVAANVTTSLFDCPPDAFSRALEELADSD